MKRDPVVSTREAAEYLGPRFNARTMERWRQQTKRTGEQVGPRFIKLPGGAVGYRVSALDEYIEQHEFVPEEVGFSA